MRDNRIPGAHVFSRRVRSGKPVNDGECSVRSGSLNENVALKFGSRVDKGTLKVGPLPSERSTVPQADETTANKERREE